MRQTFVKNSLFGAIAFGVAAAVFIAFSVYYTRAYGVAEYGEFSLLLNTLAALIALGAYDGFLINHSLAHEQKAFDRFNRKYFLLNASLAVAAGIVFSLTTGRISPAVIACVMAAIFFDYRSQSPIAVLIVNDDNWKIRAVRALYQVVLIAVFLCARFVDVAIDYAFAMSLLAAALIHYLSLRYHASRHLTRGRAHTDRAEASSGHVAAGVLLIAISSNLASVAMMLLDKALIKIYGLGTPHELGTYFLYFDLATRIEAFYLLMAVPITNYLYNAVQSNGLPTKLIYLMIAGCFVVGAIFALGGWFIVPPLYGLSDVQTDALSSLFGLYVAARGIRYLTKAVCNSCGAHSELLHANLAALVTALTIVLCLWLLYGPVLSVLALTALLVAANMVRLVSLLRVVWRRSGRIVPSPGEVSDRV